MLGLLVKIVVNSFIVMLPFVPVKQVTEVHGSFCITSIVGSELIPVSVEAVVSSIVDPGVALSGSVEQEIKI